MDSGRGFNNGWSLPKLLFFLRVFVTQGNRFGCIAGFAGWIASLTVKGRDLIDLCLEARVEIRKVVWPSRQETTQTTIVV